MHLSWFGTVVAYILDKTRSVIDVVMETQMKILVVDDDVHFASAITENLTEWGYETEMTVSAADALTKLGTSVFDLVLLDVFLPDCRGYDLIPRLRQIRPDINVITMTAHNTREIEKKVRQQQILYYMPKPFEFEQLRCLLEYFEKTRAHRYDAESSNFPFLSGLKDKRM